MSPSRASPPLVAWRPDVIASGEVGVDGLREAVPALREMQHDGLPVQLHPGDLGWHWRFGAEATAAATRTWSRDGEILAVALLDGPRLLRVAVAPEAQHDEELASRMAADVTEPANGVLPDGDVCVEARFGDRFRRCLLAAGWDLDEPWTPLRRDLAQPVGECGLRIEVIGPDRADVRAALHRAAFAGSTFTEAHWRAMAAGLPYADGRCLVGHDGAGIAVAATTVWSAGRGRPGLLEPVGVHHEHRGHGHGTAITVAAAAALRDVGCSSATVCTPASNAAAVATYESAGFRRLPDVRDLRRSGHASPA